MTSKVKIPKRIAGVKIPKQARKTANKAIRMSANPVVRELAVAAIGAAGSKAAGDAKEARIEACSGRAEIHIDAGKVGEAFRTAAIDGLRRFLEGFEEGLRNLQEEAKPAGRRGPNRANAPGAGPD